MINYTNVTQLKDNEQLLFKLHITGRINLPRTALISSYAGIEI
jgi:hypothetical protein